MRRNLIFISTGILLALLCILSLALYRLLNATPVTPSAQSTPLVEDVALPEASLTPTLTPTEPPSATATPTPLPLEAEGSSGEATSPSEAITATSTLTATFAQAENDTADEGLIQVETGGYTFIPPSNTRVDKLAQFMIIVPAREPDSKAMILLTGGVDDGKTSIMDEFAALLNTEGRSEFEAENLRPHHHKSSSCSQPRYSSPLQR